MSLLNRSNQTLNINTFKSGVGINITNVSNTSESTCNVKISSNTSQKTSLADDDILLLEDSGGNVKYITGAHLESHIDTNFWTFSTPNIYPKLTSENLLIGTTSNTDSRKLLVNGTSEFQGVIYSKGASGVAGYINLYDIDKLHHTSLYPTENINANVYLPNISTTLVGTNTTDTLTFKTLTSPTITGTGSIAGVFTGNLTGNADTSTKISSITNSNIVQLTDSQVLTNKTITGTFTGSLSGNADTSTKISSITNSNIVQLTTTQILTNKSFNDTTVFEVGLAVKQSSSSVSGNIRFFDKNNSNYIDLHIENHTVGSNYNMYLPNDIDETVLVGTRNTQTIINKTLSTGTVYNGNTIAVGYGGTGIASYTSGDILYSSGTTTLSKLAIGSNNRFLMSNGSAPVWALGYSLSSPLIFTGMNISINGLSGNGSNNQIITSTGSGLTYSSTLTSVALSSCTGNISQFTNDSSYLTSITTPLTTAVNFGTSATGAVSIGKSNQGLNLIGNGIFLDYTVPFTIGIVSEFIASSLISYDGSITSMVFGEKGGSGYNSAIHSNTVLNLSLTNTAYDITMSSTAGDITYTSPEHHFSGIIKTFGSSIFVGADNSAPNLEVAINHSTSSSVGSSFVVFYYNHGSTSQIGDIGQVGTSSVAFNETSDYRLKQDITDFNDCLGIINKLKVRKYKFINDINAGIDLNFIGFLAHEVNEASDYFNTVVSGKKDETAMWCNKCNSFNCKCGDNCGDMIMKNKYQAIDYAKFTPYLTGSIQQLHKIIQEQEQEINTLKTELENIKSILLKNNIS